MVILIIESRMTGILLVIQTFSLHGFWWARIWLHLHGTSSLSKILQRIIYMIEILPLLSVVLSLAFDSAPIFTFQRWEKSLLPSGSVKLWAGRTLRRMISGEVLELRFPQGMLPTRLLSYIEYLNNQGAIELLGARVGEAGGRQWRIHLEALDIRLSLPIKDSQLKYKRFQNPMTTQDRPITKAWKVSQALSSCQPDHLPLSWPQV